jgi:hypothetical protein
MALRPTLTDGLPLSWNSETALAVDGEIHHKGDLKTILIPRLVQS